jgi:hypothetical protein
MFFINKLPGHHQLSLLEVLRLNSLLCYETYCTQHVCVTDNAAINKKVMCKAKTTFMAKEGNTLILVSRYELSEEQQPDHALKSK